MVNKKGISLISLVIIIIVTIILIGIATTAGYRYITEGNRIEAETVVSLISQAAYRRQNDLSSGITNNYYEGYRFDAESEEAKQLYALTETIPNEDVNSNGVPDCLEKEGANWFLFDAESAQNLGILEANRFITRNISYSAGVNKENVKLVLADYATGEGYLVSIPKGSRIPLKLDDGCLNSSDGHHNFKIMATCTRAALCIYCGQEDPDTPALGHDFALPTCTSSGICKRCGAVDPENGPLGHLMISNSDITDMDLVTKMQERDCQLYLSTVSDMAWVTDALKHWNECIRCGTKLNEVEHKKGYLYDENTHYQLCSECGWKSVKATHIFKPESISNTTHKCTCTVCGYSTEHTDSGWKPDHPIYHYRICDHVPPCETDFIIMNGERIEVLWKEEHYDHNHDYYCDACGRCLDSKRPIDFGTSDEYYAKMIGATTSTITVEAYTEDLETSIQYYEFGVYNPITDSIEWLEKVYPTSQALPVKQTIQNLKADTEYDIFVKATDLAGNSTTEYKIPDTKTIAFPELKGLTNIPNDYVQGPIQAGIAEIEGLQSYMDIVYSQDGGSTWQTIKNKDISKAIIELTKERETILMKLRDADYPTNESAVTEYIIEKIDKTAPNVTVSVKDGEDNTVLAAIHTAKVTVADAKAGIAPYTEIKYAWSKSNTVVPTTWDSLYTQNTQNASSVSMEIPTPIDGKGEYYLWISKGIKDRVLNETTENYCSPISFLVDNIDVVVTNIQMLDLEPKVLGQTLFVKTGGTVTVSFDVDKPLGEDPIVKLNGQSVEMRTADQRTYVGTLEIPDTFEEGVLKLHITNIVSETGKVSTAVYDNDDLTKGPVIYDKTIPKIEYIRKR